MLVFQKYDNIYLCTVQFTLPRKNLKIQQSNTFQDIIIM